MLRICALMGKVEGVNMLRNFTQPTRQLKGGGNMLRIFYLFSQF